MKILRQIAIVFTLFMALALLIFLYLNRQFTYEQRDLVYYNDMLHKVVNAYNNGQNVGSIERAYDCQIVLSKDLDNPELAEMYRNNAFVLDFAPRGEYIGKVAWLDQLDHYDTAKRGFFGMAIILWTLILLLGYWVLIQFYLYVVKPTKELEHFATQIARGNLDEPLPIHKHNFFGHFVEAFDIMREQLKESRIREMNAEKARKELVTELSHDVKTPVAVIKATCEVMEAKYEMEKIREGANLDQIQDAESKLGTISQKADTISQLITNMMHANLEDLEQLKVEPTEENSRILSELFDHLKHYGNIVMENEIPGCLVYMDKIRMEQVIDNVIGNAAKYAGTDVHVHFDNCSVETDVPGKKAEFLRIRIRDFGPGVKEDELPMVCEKYFRGSNSTGEAGSGLGFYLVKYFMKHQGGGMEYYNDDGFVVELLLKKV